MRMFTPGLAPHPSVSPSHRPNPRRSRRGTLSALLALFTLGIVIGAANPASAQVSFSYYGAEFSEEAVVFVIDRGLPMSSSGQLLTAQEQTTAAIQNLSPNAWFAVAAFNETVTETSPVLQLATPANRTAAIDFVNDLTAVGFGCSDIGYARGFEILEASRGLFDEAVPIVLLTTTSSSCAPVSSVAATLATNLGGAVARGWAGPSAGWIGTSYHIAMFAGSGPDSIQSTFVRGDVNDDGQVNIADAILILQLGFGLTSAPFCRDAADVAADGTLEPISDAVSLLAALFTPGANPIPAPFPNCDLEAAPNGLTCYGTGCP